MKYKYYIFLSFFFSCTVFAQLDARKPLNGRVVSDSVSVEGITIYNKSFKRGAVSSPEGFFTLFAKPKDTLVFSSVQIKPTEIILTENDFKYKLYLIYLEVEVNELDEIIIRPKRYTGNLAKDAKGMPILNVYESFDSENINKMQFEADALSLPKNPAMLSNGTIPQGADFVEIFKLIAPDIFKKKKKESSAIENRKQFKDLVKSTYSAYFFADILKLKPDDIDRFIIFCEDDPKLKPILKESNEFLLTEFLIQKRKTFE
jgi:hypothetical protein